jgi:hypothetical protein
MQMDQETPVKRLVRQVEAFVQDKRLCGRLYADLTDLLEACNWFVSTVQGIDKELSRDELESLLIKIDVNVLQHLGYHLESLKQDMPVMLDAIGLPEDKEAE